ncbi:transposase [Paenibacillus sp. YAF4_2]|uniref:transposase n=1 Tax=Paenibacillus sp. YAF4_2 TaxID=3233085 RepID=UPI003F95B707
MSSRKESKREIRRKKLERRIRRIFLDSRRLYGIPKVHKMLLKQQVKVSEKTVSKIMKELGEATIHFGWWPLLSLPIGNTWLIWLVFNADVYKFPRNIFRLNIRVVLGKTWKSSYAGCNIYIFRYSQWLNKHILPKFSRIYYFAFLIFHVYFNYDTVYCVIGSIIYIKDCFPVI